MDPFERRTGHDANAWLIARALEERGVLAAFTERTGGSSGPPFASLNLGLADGDDPARVGRNRQSVADALGVPAPVLGRQVHGAAIRTVRSGDRGRGFAGTDGAVGDCDALLTDEPDTPLAILTADCVPLALSDGRRIAAVHVGWRGAAAGIVGAAVARFAEPAEVIAALGPAIGPCHYEVGREVIDRVATALPAGVDPRAERRAGAWFLDLPGTVAAALTALGVGTVDATGLCTVCEADRFFSYRRDGRTGRQAMIVVRR